MPKFRKKPVTIEAMKWEGVNQREMFEFLGGGQCGQFQVEGENFYIDHTAADGGLVIKTMEGGMAAKLGDYIIKGVVGEFYPCNPNVFSKTYEAV